MTECKKEITREIYDAAGGENGNVLPSKCREAVFSDSELFGYGVYYPTVYEEDGKYYCKYSLGDSCD
jgi:hypothetical protein